MQIAFGSAPLFLFRDASPPCYLKQHDSVIERRCWARRSVDEFPRSGKFLCRARKGHADRCRREDEDARATEFPRAATMILP